MIRLAWWAPIDWSALAAHDPPVAPHRPDLAPVWQPPPPWTPEPWRAATGRWVEDEATHAAHVALIAGLPDGGGVLGDAGTEWQETEVAEAHLPVRRTP